MNRFIPDDIVEEIRSRSDIVAVINSYFPLKRAGNRFKALCPFHAEKTPSFIVNPDTNTYHCFGCGKGGDIFRFVMEKENVDFPNAVHLLAVKCGVDIPEPEYRGRDRGGEARKSGELRRRLYDLHEMLSGWYLENLKNNPDSPVSKYAAKRGIDTDTAEKFRIGAAPDMWDGAKNIAMEKGFSEEELLQAGILVKHETSGRTYDRFRNRLVFSIVDPQERVTGFSARTVDPDLKGAKYVNSPETPIFKKSRILYGLSMARTAFRDFGYAIVCEGQLDVIAMHRAGYSCAVAPQGTAFTPGQAEILKRYCDRLMLAFDSDEAGVNAALKVIETTLPLGFEVKIIPIPEGNDPDGIFSDGGAGAIREIVEQSLDFYDYILARAKNKYDPSSAWGLDRIIGEVGEVISGIKSPVAKSSYLSHLADDMGIPESAVFQKLKQQKGGGSSLRREEKQENGKIRRKPKTGGPEAKAHRAEETLLHLALEHGTIGKRLAEQLPDDMISKSPVGNALRKVINITLDGEWQNAAGLLSAELAENPEEDISRILAMPPIFDEKEDEKKLVTMHEKAVSECIRAICEVRLRKAVRDLMAEWKEAAGEGREDEIRRKYLEKMEELKEILNPGPEKVPEKEE